VLTFSLPNGIIASEVIYMSSTSNYKKINISIPVELISQVEEFSKKTKQSKSGFICQAVRSYIDSIRYFSMLEEMQKAFERLGQKGSNDEKIMKELNRMLTALSIMNEAGKKGIQSE
jgi:predicted DNA-binding protein